jgi:predicted phage-related endonuclease
MLEKVNAPNPRSGPDGHRRDFIGGSDARIIMGQDEKALIRLWQEKRGEVGPEDLTLRQPYCPARLGDRGPQPGLV